MVTSLQHHQDILLIPRDWWPALQGTLGPEEPGWWYTVSSEMWYQGCSSCKNRIGKDHQDAERCPECPAKIKKRKNPGSKKTQDKKKGRSERANDRPSRSGPPPNYAEPSDDPITDEDLEEEAGKDSGEIQQGYLCISADPRRVGAGGGEAIILNLRELLQAIVLQQTTEDHLHPAISEYIADWEADLTSTGTQPPPLAHAAIDLENEWSQKYVLSLIHI